MKLAIKKKKVNEFLVSAFVFICVVFPGDIYSLKKILFFIICIINAKLVITSLANKRNNMIAFFGFVFPTILFLYSVIMTGNVLLSFSRSFAAYMFLLIFVVKHYEIDFERILIKSIKLIMVTTVSLALLDVVGAIDVNAGFFRNEIMYGYGLGLMGKSPFYPFYYKIFFKTSPLLVILLFKRFNESNYFTTLLTLTALIISGTRANVLFPIFFLAVFYVLYTGNKSKIFKYAFVSITITCALLFSGVILEAFNEAFILKAETSNIVRQGHIEGLIELIKNDPWIILRGSGMGSEFYSYGTDSYVNAIEWSYLDLWRQMGFLFFFLFLSFVILPLFYRYEVGNYKKYSYITYLCIAATNPLLFSSTSYLVFIYMYYDLKKYKLLQESRK